MLSPAAELSAFPGAYRRLTNRRRRKFPRGHRAGQTLVLSDTIPDGFESCHFHLLAMRIGEITPQGLVFLILKSSKDDGSTGGRHPRKARYLAVEGKPQSACQTDR